MKDDTNTTPADSALLRQFAHKASASAFEELVRRHLDHVFSAALRRVNGDHALAEDVTQTVFADFARKAKRIPADMPPGGWLHRHTGFIASKMIDKERRRRHREQEAATMNATQQSTVADPEWSATAPLLDSAMDTLPNSDRDAIVLRFFEQKDFRSVGAALGVSDDTAQKRVSRAMDKLRTVLGKRGVKSTGGALATLMVAHSVSASPQTLAAQISTQSLAGAATAGGTLIEAITGLTNAARIKAGIAAIALASAAGYAGSQLAPPAAEEVEVKATASGTPTDTRRAPVSVLANPTVVQPVAAADPMTLEELILAAAAKWRGGKETIAGNAQALGFLVQVKPEQMPEALAIAQAFPAELVRVKLMKNLLSHWAETDFKSAQIWALSDAAGVHAADLAQGLKNTWAANNPNAAIVLSMKSSARAFSELPSDESAIATVIGAFAKQNLEVTIAHLDQIPPTKLFAALRGIFDTIQSDADREQILPLIYKIRDNQTRIQARRAIVEHWARSNPSAAAAYVEKAEPAWERTRLMDSLGFTWLQREPETAANWWEEHAPGPDTLVKIINVWAQQDPNSAGEWLDKHPPGPASDTARMTFARQVADLDQESALLWAVTVSDSTMREGTIDHVYTDWHLRDAGAAENFLQNSDWPQERITRLRNNTNTDT